MAERIYKETHGKHKGWWIGKYPQFKVPSGKPRRARLIHDDNPDFNFYRDKKGIKRKYSDPHKDTMLETEYAKHEARFQAEEDVKKSPLEPATESAKYTLGEAIDKYRKEIILTLASSSQPGYFTMSRWWKDNYGKLTLEQMDVKKCREARDALSNTIITRNGNGKGKQRSNSFT